ncbi:Rheb small monomeric GTPase [Colletotrichum tofieldiae]|nr:Rheb small monomeric GTPase [Colletotrichum tofieldiae]
MATRDGPNVPRKKTTTYGKTSRKRPIHAFLDLSSGSRRAPDTTQPTTVSTASADHLYDLYDPPDDEPVHRSIPRRDAPFTDATASQPDGSSNLKKRKVSAAPTTKVERARKIDGKPSAAAAPLARAPLNIRRAKSPFTSGASSSLRATKEEPAARVPGQLKTQRQVKALPAASLPRAEPEVPRKTEPNLQIRRALLQPSHPQPAFVQSKLNTFVTDLSISKPKKLPEPRRARLIDQLVAQTEVSSESDSDASDDSEVSLAGFGAKTASPSTPARPVDMTPKPSLRPKVLSSTRKLRSTYGQQRTLKADESGGDSLGSQMGIDGIQRDLSPAPTMSKLASFAFEEEDVEEEDSSKGGGIIDIHALRQAGANHRFADSMADILDRVGTPQPPRSSSARSRRNALLELASKLRDKTFVRQFRDQGAKDALFQAIGQEEDLVSGFALLSVLLVLFASYSVPHLVPQLQSEGIAQLASRLFELDEDIVGFAGQRQSNLSRNAQSSLSALKSTIQQLDLWKGSPPAVLSPRIVALKAISVLCKDGDSPATRDILAGLTDQLFVFAEKGWEQSRAEGIEGTIGGLALSLLEGYSIAAMESDAGPRWTELYLPIVADILTAAMARPMQQFGDFESTTLKLALNTTNNNPAAASAFSRGELFRELAEASVVGFELLQQSVRQGAFSKDVYETLMLLLGVMINTTEHCPSTRRSVDAWHGRDESPLDKLMDVYLENRESAGTVSLDEEIKVARNETNWHRPTRLRKPRLPWLMVTWLYCWAICRSVAKCDDGSRKKATGGEPSTCLTRFKSSCHCIRS